jgi:hypothetical protein
MTKKTIPEPAPVVNEPRQEWQRDMERATPTSLVRSIADDFRRGPAGPSSIAGARSVNEPRVPSGGTVEVRPPPGINYIDQMCDHADRQEKIAAIRQRIENEWIEAKLDRSKPNRAKV